MAELNVFETEILPNFINGNWTLSQSNVILDVHNPATDRSLAQVPLSTPAEAHLAATAAANAFEGWARTPPTERIQYLFRFKNALEIHFEELARTITIENGKTIKEARGELHRAVENIEVACGIPLMMQGGFLEDIARGIDEFVVRQPVGVCAIIAPFNFPGMIPFWFFPYALACGNTVIIKPSERTPLTMWKIFHILETIDLPDGVVNLVNGGPVVVNSLLDHPDIKAISFVGSTPVARHIYSRASASGKRVQAQAGAKNPLIVMPDADLEMTTQIITDSVFGNAGQRCLAGSLVITVGNEAKNEFTPALCSAAATRIVGFGVDENVEMGPVISQKSKERISAMIQTGINEGAIALVDGRNPTIKGYENGYFLRPTILDQIRIGGEVHRTEIFGPVMGLIHVDNIDQAIQLVNTGEHGNMACIFTSSGAAARKFRSEAKVGNIGINIGVAAPMAFFPFSGWRDSFFGTLHGQADHAVEFFTQTKVVIERWPKEWSRRF